MGHPGPGPQPPHAPVSHAHCPDLRAHVHTAQGKGAHRKTAGFLAAGQVLGVVHQPRSGKPGS